MKPFIIKSEDILQVSSSFSAPFYCLNDIFRFHIREAQRKDWNLHHDGSGPPFWSLQRWEDVESSSCQGHAANLQHSCWSINNSPLTSHWETMDKKINVSVSGGTEGNPSTNQHMFLIEVTYVTLTLFNVPQMSGQSEGGGREWKKWKNLNKRISGGTQSTTSVLLHLCLSSSALLLSFHFSSLSFLWWKPHLWVRGRCSVGQSGLCSHNLHPPTTPTPLRAAGFPPQKPQQNFCFPSLLSPMGDKKMSTLYFHACGLHLIVLWALLLWRGGANASCCGSTKLMWHIWKKASACSTLCYVALVLFPVSLCVHVVCMKV